ncbi:hypothetical protein CBL_04852 [Carabus blaptoides fortunei]
MNKTKYKEQQMKQNTLYVGTWNVRGTYSEGAIKSLINEAKRYKLDIIALQETKQKGNGIVDMKDYIFFNSGGQNRRLGTGFLINKRISQEVLEFRPISDRIYYLRIRGKQRKLSYINIYAPTGDTEEEKKNKFYEKMDNKNRVTGYDPAELQREDKQKQYEEEIESRIINFENISTIMEKWECIEDAVKTAAKNMLTVNKKKKGKPGTTMSARNRRIIREEMIINNTEENRTKYKEIRAKAKKICRHKKRLENENRIKTIEEKFSNKEIRNFYQDVKKAKIGDRENADRWKEYFEELLNDRDNEETEVEMEEQRISIEGNQTDTAINPPTM